MGVAHLDQTFGSVLPRFRDRVAILADIQAGVAGGDEGEARAHLAEVELHIATGDEAFRSGRYDAALGEFQTARGLIYGLMHPDFDVGTWRGRSHLPVSVDIEKSLQDVSVRAAAIIRPTAAPRPTIPPPAVVDRVPDELARFEVTGFHPPVVAESLLKAASAQGVALMQEGKPEAAVKVMQDALTATTAGGAQPNPAFLGALELNLSSASIQLKDQATAADFAERSRQSFVRAGDNVGVAQATHVAAVVAAERGDPNALALFTEASDELGAPSTPPAGPPGAPPPRRVVPPSGRFSLQRSGSLLTAGAIEDPRIVLAATRAQAAEAPILVLSSDVATLSPISERQDRTVTFRIPGSDGGWGVIPAALDGDGADAPWQVGVPVGDQVIALPVGAGTIPSQDQVVADIYRSRVSATKFSQIDWQIVDTSTTSFYLTHLYGYVLPVKIGDSQHELGQYQKAEDSFLQAASYSFLNVDLEGTPLWIRLAGNAADWGDSLYRAEDMAGAKTQYGKVIGEQDEVPTSILYSTAGLSVGADQAKTVIQNLLTRPLPDLNPEIAALILRTASFLHQLLAGLDYFGLLLSPIHTFEYLQSVAHGFGEEAVQAERSFVEFKSRQEAEEATRRDLETTLAMSNAEAQGRQRQYEASQEDELAAQRANDLAVQRRDDATRERSDYAGASAVQVWSQAAATAQGGGSDSWYGEISELADKLDRGESISGDRGKLAAAYTLQAGRRNREYELAKMQDNINELATATGIAQAQLDASHDRTLASEIAWQAAVQRAQMASDALTAFDQEYFTPETWSKMADVMRDISRSYLYRATRIAKLMERAYNFDNDTDLRVIKDQYGTAVSGNAAGQDARLLGGDSLLVDIDSFTYHAITTKTRKSSRIKDVLSIATGFPAQFESFRSTGLLSFETDLYEFDRLHPGFFGQRIEAVEIEIVGLIPDIGLNGTLTAGGVSSFRRQDGSAGTRAHVVDAMALSDFALRNDMFVYTAETGVRGLFQGLGVGTTWQLHLPKRSNDFDFRRIYDIHLILYHMAQFDPGLRQNVLAAPARPGELALIRNFNLRFDFPDAWYGFYANGQARFTLNRSRLPFNQQDFRIQSVHFRVVTKDGVSNQGIDVSVTSPAGSSGTATTDENGAVTSDGGGLAGIAGTDPIGPWQVDVTGGASVTDGGQLKFDRVTSIQMGLEYEFHDVPEAL